MGYDVAVFGELVVPPNARAAWKKLDATSVKWPDGFGVAATTRATIGAFVKRYATAPDQAWGWHFSTTPRVTIRGVMPDDCWLDNARPIAQLWLCGAEVGATGTLSFRGFETADTGWIIKLGKRARVTPMTKTEKAAADASREMAVLHEAMTELLGAQAYNPFTKKRS